MRRRVKKMAFYIVDFGGTEMSESGYNQKKKMDIYIICIKVGLFGPNFGCAFHVLRFTNQHGKLYNFRGRKIDP